MALGNGRQGGDGDGGEKAEIPWSGWFHLPRHPKIPYLVDSWKHTMESRHAGRYAGKRSRPVEVLGLPTQQPSNSATQPSLEPAQQVNWEGRISCVKVWPSRVVTAPAGSAMINTCRARLISEVGKGVAATRA